MLIYNIQMLLIGLLVLPISYFASKVNPDFASIVTPEFWLIVFPIACISAGIGMKPRFFMYPLWLFAFVVLLWRSIVVYSVFGVVLSITAGILFIAIGIVINIKISMFRWNNCKKLLAEFEEGLISIDKSQLVYYPENIYGSNQLYEKYFDKVFQYFQVFWFSRKDVKEHYLKLIEKSKNELLHEHLKFLIQDEVKKNGIQKFLLVKLAKDLKED